MRARARLGLGTRLVLLGTLVTLAAIASAFGLLSLEIRRQSRDTLADLLQQNQATVVDLLKRNRSELLWTSRLMTQSPTLRAAMETYASERPARPGGRADLVATVQTELDRIRALLGKDLAVITDVSGAILAASPAAPAPARADAALASHPCVTRALRSDAPAGDADFGVLERQGEHFEIGCVPIVLQDYVIGALLVGERIDGRLVEGLKASLHSDVIVTWGDTILESTLPAFERGASAAGILRASGGPAGAGAAVFEAGGEDRVVAPLSLGMDAQGRQAALLLLKSLSQARAAASRSLVRALLICGLFAMLLASLAAWRLARSILDPLERFVAFMRQVAESNDTSRPFEGSEGAAEIQILKQAYNLLIASLEAQRMQLLSHAREELVRVERLKESEKLASLGRMLSGAAHEINNPLTGVLGNVEILLESSSIEGGARQRLETVQREARRIVGLVRSLLRVAHRDTGRRDVVDLNAVVRDAAALREHDFRAARLEMRLDLSPEPLRLEANALELQQVLLNIINNAYDALKEKARQPLLLIRTALESGQAVVRIEDGGPGIADPGKVFDPFYTTKDVGKGTGLGLSISHAIVRNHGGRISAENRAEGGARFIILLPALPDAAAAVPVVRREERSAAPRLSIAVLVLEDEPTILELQLAILGSLGATATGTRSAAEAIACLQRRRFDVIVADLRIPGGLSGQDVFRWIETHRPESAARVLFVTGDSASEATMAFLKDSGRRYLIKPFSVGDYVTAIQETLGALRPAA